MVRRVFTGLTLLLICACSSSQRNSDKFKEVTPSNSDLVLPIEKLTRNGVNTFPELSKDGKFLVFVSSQREDHKHPQAYLLDLEPLKTTRLTYQNGIVHQILAVERNDYVYVSDTDEIKENPDFIRKALADPNAPPEPEGGAKNPMAEILPRTELYRYRQGRNRIDRLTNRKGFDGFISLHPKRPEVVYSYWNGLHFEMAAVNLNSKQRIIISKDAYDIHPKHSKDGSKLAWVRWYPSSNHAELRVGSVYAKRSQPVLSQHAIYRTPNWGPKDQWLYFSANIHDFTNYELYRVRIDGSCLQRLTYHTSTDSHPQVLPDGNSLIFQSNRSGVSHLYKLDLQKLETCPKKVSTLQ